MTGLRQLGNADEYWREYEYMEYCDDVRDSEVAEEGSTGAAAGLNALAQTIESEIVPRLMMAHRADLEPAGSGVREAIEPSQADVVDFADTVVSGDMKAALGRIEDLRRRGVTLESIYVDLMAPAARHLGVLWLEDRCDFVTVTLGLSRMQQLLSALGTASGPERLTPDRSSKALLTTIPGDQHTFGLYMVAEFFRRSGWDVWGGVPEGPSSVVQFVRDDWFDVVGLSVSLQGSLPDLAETVGQIRKCSRNDRISVLLGGSAFHGNQHAAEDFGAHAIIANGKQAVARAQALVRQAARNLS